MSQDTRHTPGPMVEAISAFARAWGHGRRPSWRQLLQDAWMTGQYPSWAENTHLLQQARNTLGPSWLVRFKPDWRHNAQSHGE